LEGGEPVADIKEMHAVEDLIGEKAQHRNAEIQDVVVEEEIVHKEVDVDETVLHLREKVPKVFDRGTILILHHVKFISLRSLGHEDEVGLLNTHFFDTELSL